MCDATTFHRLIEQVQEASLQQHREPTKANASQVETIRHQLNDAIDRCDLELHEGTFEKPDGAYYRSFCILRSPTTVLVNSDVAVSPNGVVERSSNYFKPSS